MQLAGYEIRQGKHLSFRAPEQQNFTYMKSLGSYYSEENVRIRLAMLCIITVKFSIEVQC